MSKRLEQLIVECETLVAELTSNDGLRLLAKTLVEKVVGDAAGNVTGVELKNDCPSATRERLSMAHEIAASNEKEIRSEMEFLRKGIEINKSAGTDTSEYEAKYAALKEKRKIAIDNMGKLESIESDYAQKFKPSNNKYDQRAHAMFLEKSRERLEARKKEAESSSMPDFDRIEALERRIGRVDAAQKESRGWLEANDKGWIAMRDRAVALKKEEESPKKGKEKLTAKKTKALETTPSGATQPGQPQPAQPPKQSGTAPTTATTSEPKETEKQTAQQVALKVAADAEPGTTWKTSKGRFGAKNGRGEKGNGQTGVKYFESEQDAKVYAEKTGAKTTTRSGSETSTRRKKPDRKPVERKQKEIAGKITKAEPPTALAAGDFAAELVGNRLKSLMETYRDSGLGKWFSQSADDTPGWDRYNTKGNRIGKCGDAEEGEAYAACLSPEKAQKLGKEGIASFVRRKRAAQRKAGMGKKGQGDTGGGEEPVRVSTGIDKVDEAWSQEYKDSIDCNNPKGFSQRAHCQGKEKKMNEEKEVSVEELKDAIKELIDLIKKHEKLAYEAKKAGKTDEYRMHRGHVAEFSADIKTVQDMIKRAMLKKTMPISEGSKNEPTNPELWAKVQDLVAGRISSMEHNGETIEGPNGGKGFDVHPSAYSNAWASKLYKSLGGNWRSVKESMESAVASIVSNTLSRKTVKEEKKPFKGFVKGKNHPEGGLSRAEAKRQGIHAGIETKDEAERKGGFSKLSPKTQKRRQSFCSRMCGMKEKNTSPEVAADPDSKINAALRVWGCRC